MSVGSDKVYQCLRDVSSSKPVSKTLAFAKFSCPSFCVITTREWKSAAWIVRCLSVGVAIRTQANMSDIEATRAAVWEMMSTMLLLGVAAGVHVSNQTADTRLLMPGTSSCLLQCHPPPRIPAWLFAAFSHFFHTARHVGILFCMQIFRLMDLTRSHRPIT